MSEPRIHAVPGPAPEDRDNGVTDADMNEVWNDLIKIAFLEEGDLVEVESAVLRLALRSTIANAPLLTAGPAMLAALKGLLLEWEKLTGYGSPLAKAANERVNAAVRAVAMAEGRA